MPMDFFSPRERESHGAYGPIALLDLGGGTQGRGGCNTTKTNFGTDFCSMFDHHSSISNSNQDFWSTTANQGSILGSNRGNMPPMHQKKSVMQHESIFDTPRQENSVIHAQKNASTNPSYVSKNAFHFPPTMSQILSPMGEKNASANPTNISKNASDLPPRMSQILSSMGEKNASANLQHISKNASSFPANLPQILSPMGEKNAQPLRGKKKRALDLFSGSGSVAHALRNQGYEVFTLDNNPRCNANWQVDILEWPVEEFYKPGYFHLVAASPPCTEYSNAMTCRPRELEKADRIVQRTIDIINYLKPSMWWIENPRHGKLSTREVVAGLPYVDIDFCRFSTWGYQKPTRFWCSKNIAKRSNVLCEKKCANLVPTPHGGLWHKYAIGNRYREGPPKGTNK